MQFRAWLARVYPAQSTLDARRRATDNGGVNAIHLTPARRGDVPRLAAMTRRLIESGLEPCWTVARIERQLRNPDSVVLSARAARDIAGFAIMQYGDDAAHLVLLAVQPAFRRNGIGRQLVAWLEDTARVAGTFTIRLEVRSGNATARAFYAALGYRESGHIRGYYQGLEDAIRLSRCLSVQRSTAAP